jgi:hypothetical protein
MSPSTSTSASAAPITARRAATCGASETMSRSISPGPLARQFGVKIADPQSLGRGDAGGEAEGKREDQAAWNCSSAFDSS